MISVQFSFPNLYKLEDCTFGSQFVPSVGDIVRVYGERFKVIELEWTVSSSLKYLGGVVVHLNRVG